METKEQVMIDGKNYVLKEKVQQEEIKLNDKTYVLKEGEAQKIEQPKENAFVRMCIGFYKGFAGLMGGLAKNMSQYHEDVKDESFMGAQLPKENKGSRK